MTTTSRRMAKTRGAITANEIAECLAMPAPDRPTHPCTRCTRAIDSRYPFVVCVRCSLDELAASLEADGYYEKRDLARARIAELEDRARMVAKGLLKE